MKVAILANDNRNKWRRYSNLNPDFGPAPAALLEGLALMPDCEVHVISCLRRPVHSPVKLYDNVYYHSLVVRKWGWMGGAYLGCIAGIRRKLREIKPDLVHGQGSERYCAVAAVYSGLPNVLTIHGNMRLIAKLYQSRPFSFYWLAARLEAFTLPRSDGVVCISGYTQNAVAPLARATWILPNAVESVFFELELRAAFPKEILCPAHISTRKNQVRLIRALQPLALRENFQLIFCGRADRKDPYAREFFQLLEENSWCRFAGFADRAELRAALARATMLVLPSLEDNCPMAVLEAMAAGLPVAAARVGGIPDLIADGIDGLLFDPENEESIRAAVAELLVNERKRLELGQRGKEAARLRFHPKCIAQQHVAIYKEVIAMRQPCSVR